MLDYRFFQTRYRFEGTLTLETALHIGTGQVATLTDSPILRNAAGEPFIPGASLKGAFRAAVSRIAPNLDHPDAEKKNFQICDPFGVDDFCISPQKGILDEAYRNLRGYLGRSLPTAKVERNEDVNHAIDALETFGKEDWKGKTLTEKDLLTLLEENLCPVCQVFGSPYYAAKARFDDLPVKNWFQVREIRDGVGIDRDSERAIDGIKYDFEVVPAGTTFKFGLTLENPSEQDAGLIAIGLREMEEAMIRLGGIRSRGLGVCRLTLEKIEKLDATDPKQLMAYLKKRGNREVKNGREHEVESKEERIQIEAFFAEAIDKLFAQLEV